MRSPKIYFRDSGIFHTLININSYADLQLHPLLGHSWECFAMEEIIRHHRADPEDCYFWSTQQGAELDLLLMQHNKRIGFEIKYSSTPKLTRSMQISCEDLKLDECKVIYPGDIDFPLTKNVNVFGLKNYLTGPRPGD